MFERRLCVTHLSIRVRFATFELRVTGDGIDGRSQKAVTDFQDALGSDPHANALSYKLSPGFGHTLHFRRDWNDMILHPL